MQELDENAPADAQPPPPGPWERLWDANATPAIMSLIEALAGLRLRSFRDSSGADGAFRTGAGSAASRTG